MLNLGNSRLVDLSVILLIISAIDLLLFGLLYVWNGFCPFQLEYLVWMTTVLWALALLIGVKEIMMSE